MGLTSDAELNTYRACGGYNVGLLTSLTSLYTLLDFVNISVDIWCKKIKKTGI